MFQAEKTRRRLYLRGREVVAQRERAADMKRRNGALIYNILPPHVAAYFLSRARHHDDLYSQSYAEVGVLFASMPNFADFYSEESINNQGLECLRFLNEVISDFDAVSTLLSSETRRPDVFLDFGQPVGLSTLHLQLLLYFRVNYYNEDRRFYANRRSITV